MPAPLQRKTGTAHLLHLEIWLGVPSSKWTNFTDSRIVLSCAPSDAAEVESASHRIPLLLDVDLDFID